MTIDLGPNRKCLRCNKRLCDCVDRISATVFKDPFGIDKVALVSADATKSKTDIETINAKLLDFEARIKKLEEKPV